MSKVINEVDVICEHKANGKIIPLRFQIVDEDGVRQKFTIKGYRILENHKPFDTQDGLFVGQETVIFECKIEVLGLIKVVRLYCSKDGMEWKLAF